jgi:carbamoyltransferase
MSVVVGVSALYHDAAAAVVVDGRLVAALQEERLSRMKNDPSLPIRAARACLAIAGVDGRDVERVVFYENPFAKLERVLVSRVAAFPSGLATFGAAMASQLGDKLWVLDRLGEELGVDRSKVTFVTHHDAHAASAYFTSGFEPAAILTLDGVGEATTTALYEGKGSALRRVFGVEHPHSLGLFYAAFTAWAGFAVNEGEQKFMGLAAYGRDARRADVERVLRLEEGGAFTIDPRYVETLGASELGFTPLIEELVGPRRMPRTPWRLGAGHEGGDDQRFADVACSVQGLLEDAVLALARRARREIDARDLCLAGGVALNAVANARVAAEAGFDRVFVHPAAGDAGGAVGAAFLGARELGDAIDRAPLATAALGVAVDAGRALDVAKELGLEARRVDDGAALAAQAVAAGELVAFAAGRSEWGPRALGQRSLLAPAGPEEVRHRIHRAVKEREPFRPFAPAACLDRAEASFSAVHPTMTRFMTTVSRARDEGDETLGAVVHVDGTARLQTVDETSAPALHRVLRALEARSGATAVLNTSLNAVGEPLCATELDAIAFFVERPVDLLIVDDVAIRRPR